MISLLLKRGLKFFHPILKRLTKVYLSKSRNYSFRGIRIGVPVGVFHPGLFFSTKVFITYLDGLNLEEEKVLELGAGSGLISIYCAKRGARVVASDINKEAVKGVESNARMNNQEVQVVLSDLLSKTPPENFDLILINPPYYPQKPKNIEEHAWFCGEDFEYFARLFKQLGQSQTTFPMVLMILSEDCELERIKSIAQSQALKFVQVYSKRVMGEQNFIFEIKKS